MTSTSTGLIKTMLLPIIVLLVIIELILLPSIITLKVIATTTDKKDFGGLCNLVGDYLLGWRYIGIPMAIASAGFYLWGPDFSRSKWYEPLVILRDILHPGSFFLCAPETVQTHLNLRMNYASFIRLAINEYDPKPIEVVIYILISASMWPLRAIFSGGFISLFLLCASICIIAVIILCIFKAIWFLICFFSKSITRLLYHPIEDYSQKIYGK